MLTGNAQITAVQRAFAQIPGAAAAQDDGFESLRGLFFVSLGGHRLEIFGFEDLPAIEALHVVHAVSAGEDDCIFMVAGGLHKKRLRYELL